MKSKLIAIGLAAALVAGSIGIATANPVNLISNGNFDQFQNPVANPTGPTGFGSLGSGTGGTWGVPGSCADGNFLQNWTGNGGYEIWYNNYSDASTVEPCAFYHGETQKLSTITNPADAGAGFTSFVGMDGITSPVPNAGISQSVGGLTAGQKYKVTFWWGSTQLQDRSGPTTEYLQVSLGGAPFQVTATNSLPDSHTFSGWTQVSMVFKADSSTDVLSFLSIGTPNSLPPFALLGGVSMVKAPEPPELALFGLGLFGLGLLTLGARRSALRRRNADNG